MPLHAGHIALIEFGRQHCDELIVSMSYTPVDPINGTLRFGWIREIFQPDPGIIPAISLDDFDNNRLPTYQRTKIWADFLKKRFPPIDLLFSSEAYGDSLAGHLGARHLPFDLTRNRIPVSASAIRTHPFQNWAFIPKIVRPYFVKKICFYGPESTGKSTLARHLAEVYHTEVVPEVARELITSNEFSVDDIIRIGQAQTDRVKEKLKTANQILFCDSDLITTQIYSKKYLGVAPKILMRLEREIQYDLHFLFDIDVPWISDGLRDLGSQRREMMNVFEAELAERNIQPILVRGNWEERERIVRKEIDFLLTSARK